MTATPLKARHLDAGARLVSFAGWEMPLEYEGIRAEHESVRSRAGVFDVSHMGQVEASGPGAEAFLQRAISNDLAAVPLGGAQYGLLCREDGGVLDDLFTYRLDEDRFLTVTNAANHQSDLDWLRGLADGFDVELVDRIGDFAMLAVQGPAARLLLAGLADQPLPARMRSERLAIAGIEVLACGTGYTGEDGLELLCDPVDAPLLWDALLDAGVTPAGLGARDTLRLEVCFHLYGNDLSTERNPIEAGLGWCCKEETGFVGAEAVAAARAAGPAEILVAFELQGPGLARQGNPIEGGGEVTSGTHSPSLGVGIGMAYVPSAAGSPGTELKIDVRGRTRTALVAGKPLYRPAKA